jgi:hypothetical protein
LGINGSEQVGGLTGYFNGTIAQSGNGYTAIGTFAPLTNTYNFDITPVRTFHDLARDAANTVGTVTGQYIRLRTFGFIRPTSYDINFVGSATINQSW